MKRVIILFLVAIATVSGNAAIEVGSIVKNVISGGDGKTGITIETKYLKFISKRDGFVRYADHEIPEFKTSEAIIGSAKIRQYMDFETGAVTCFLMITVGRDKSTEVIAYEDLIKIIDAVKRLKLQCEKDCNESKTLKCYYITDDAFQIGYAVKEGKPSWYFSVEGETRKFSKDFDFEQALIDVKNKMEELMQQK